MPYRREGDPEYVLRFEDAPERGLAKKLAEFVKVAGISYEGHGELTMRLAAGADRHLTLERRPFPGHPEAIAVLASWRERGSQVGPVVVGWLPADLARRIPADIRIGATLDAIFTARRGKSPGMRISVWGPRGSRLAD